MRLPTKAEWEAFQSEQLEIHKECHRAGKCLHTSQVSGLCKMVVDSHMFAANLANMSINRSEGNLADLLFIYTVAFREGMALGYKLAEKDALEKMCSGKS